LCFWGGFSKAYAVTGWRVGYAAAPREIIGAMHKIHQYTMMCVSTMSQMARSKPKSGQESSPRWGRL